MSISHICETCILGLSVASLELASLLLFFLTWHPAIYSKHPNEHDITWFFWNSFLFGSRPSSSRSHRVEGVRPRSAASYEPNMCKPGSPSWTKSPKCKRQYSPVKTLALVISFFILKILYLFFHREEWETLGSGFGDHLCVDKGELNRIPKKSPSDQVVLIRQHVPFGIFCWPKQPRKVSARKPPRGGRGAKTILPPSVWRVAP